MNSKRVLIIDELYWSVEAVIDLIQQCTQYHVDYISNSLDAVIAFREKNYDFVITSLSLPTGNSFATIEDGKSIDSLPGIDLVKYFISLQKKTFIIVFSIAADLVKTSQLLSGENICLINKLDTNALEQILSILRLNS